MTTDSKRQVISYVAESKTEIQTKIEWYELCLSITPNDIDIICNYGKALCQLGRQKEGIELFNRALKLNSNDLEVITNKGVANLELKNYDEAMKCFEIAITLNKNYAKAHLNRGIIYAIRGDLKRALICFNIAISIDPKCQEAIHNRAKVLIEQGKFDESIESFNKLSLDHESAELFLVNKGRTYDENNRLAEALECNEKCISIGKIDSDCFRDALLSKATILTKFKRHTEAINTYDKLISMKRCNEAQLVNAHYLKGKNYYFLKKYDLAVDSYKKAMEINSTDPVVHECCGDSLIGLKKYKEALICFEKAVQKTDSKSPKLDCLIDKKEKIESMIQYEYIQKEELNDFYQILLRFE